MPDIDDELEAELREGLRLREAPDGFAGRLMARVDADRNRLQFSPRAALSAAPIVRWAIAAMLLLAVGLGSYTERQRRERIAGEHARDQVLLALRITNSALQAVHDRVIESDR